MNQLLNVIQAFERELAAQVSGTASQGNRRPGSGPKQQYTAGRSAGRGRHQGQGRRHNYRHEAASQQLPRHASHQHHRHHGTCSVHYDSVLSVLSLV